MPDDCLHREAQCYADLWVPRLLPYYEDFVCKSAPKAGERVLIASVGPGAALRAVTNAMDGRGELAATDSSPAMIEMSRDELSDTNAQMPIRLEVTDAHDTLNRQWDLILHSFRLWDLPDQLGTLRCWRRAVEPAGRVALLVWGPSDPESPFEKLSIALRQTEPTVAPLDNAWHIAARQPMRNLLGQAGLKLVRHATVRHPMEFASAEGFFAAMTKEFQLLRIVQRLGTKRTARVADAFFALLDPPSPRTPIAFAPSATIVIADPN